MRGAPLVFFPSVWAKNDWKLFDIARVYKAREFTTRTNLVIFNCTEHFDVAACQRCKCAACGSDNRTTAYADRCVFVFPGDYGCAANFQSCISTNSKTPPTSIEVDRLVFISGSGHACTQPQAPMTDDRFYSNLLGPWAMYTLQLEVSDVIRVSGSVDAEVIFFTGESVGTLFEYAWLGVQPLTNKRDVYSAGSSTSLYLHQCTKNVPRIATKCYSITLSDTEFGFKCDMTELFEYMEYLVPGEAVEVIVGVRYPFSPTGSANYVPFVASLLGYEIRLHSRAIYRTSFRQNKSPVTFPVCMHDRYDVDAALATAYADPNITRAIFEGSWTQVLDENECNESGGEMVDAEEFMSLYNCNTTHVKTGACGCARASRRVWLNDSMPYAFNPNC